MSRAIDPLLQNIPDTLIFSDRSVGQINIFALFLLAPLFTPGALSLKKSGKPKNNRMAFSFGYCTVPSV